MDWIRENWFWIVVVGLFLWMHTKMHGGHGHGGHGGAGSHDHDRQHDEPSRLTKRPRARTGESGEKDQPRQEGHTHAEH